MTRVSRFTRAFLVLLCTAPLHARSTESDYDACFRESSRRYSVDERLLRAIARVESNFDSSVIHRNRDGSRDVGVMQINSTHFERLRQYGIDEAALVTRPCVRGGT